MKRGPVPWTLFGVLPALLTLAFTVGVHNHPAYDFHALWQAGRAVADGRSPYPKVSAISSNLSVAHDEFVYPAPVAVAMVPLGVLPFGVAAVLFVFVLLAAVAATLHVLGVRDWRCYGVAFASIPVLESFRLGAITPLLALGLAGVWAARDRKWTLPALVAAIVVAKLFLWPVFVWLLVSRRWAAAARATAIGAAAAVVGSAVVGFGTLASYPHILSRMTDVQFRKSYGVDGFLAAVGAGSGAAHAGVMLVAIVGIVAIAVAARQSGEQLAFGLSVLVSILASPLVWLHYDALLLVPVALSSRRLSLVWLVPALAWATPFPESGGSAWRIALTFVLAAAAVLRRPSSSRLIRWNPLRGVAQPG